jgi:hypothetical protein
VGSSHTFPPPFGILVQTNFHTEAADVRKVVVWLISVVGFLAIATIFERVDWDTVFHRASEPFIKPDPNPGTPQEQDGGSSYFPPDTLRTLYEYSMVLDAFPRAHELTMVNRVDGVRTINGKSYYKEVIEYTGWEDFIDYLKSPEGQEEISKSRELKDAMASFVEGFKPTVSYARWDKTGELDLDSDDLSAPETRTTPRMPDVGTEWSDKKGLHAKALSIEDVVIGDETFRDCLKIRASATLEGMKLQGITIYAARGIGIVKVIYPNLATITLRKYRL